MEKKKTETTSAIEKIREPERAPLEQMPIEEAGSIGEEQLPAHSGSKTDKHEWNYEASKVKKESKLPERLREFLNGL